MKKFVAGFLVGALLFSLVGVFAYNIFENPYKIVVNGEGKYIQGYNIDGYSYFKLRDVADAVGGFDVGFQNDTIQISKDGYVYEDIAYYPNGLGFAPDYSKYFNIESIDDTAIQSYCFYYQADCINHSYPYDEGSALRYMELLENIGCRKVYDGSDNHYSNVVIYCKDNNYVVVSYDESLHNSIDVYPINEADYNILLDFGLLEARPDFAERIKYATQ